MTFGKRVSRSMSGMTSGCCVCHAMPAGTSATGSSTSVTCGVWRAATMCRRMRSAIGVVQHDRHAFEVRGSAEDLHELAEQTPEIAAGCRRACDVEQRLGAVCGKGRGAATAIARVRPGAIPVAARQVHLLRSRPAPEPSPPRSVGPGPGRRMRDSADSGSWHDASSPHFHQPTEHLVVERLGVGQGFAAPVPTSPARRHRS